MLDKTNQLKYEKLNVKDNIEELNGLISQKNTIFIDQDNIKFTLNDTYSPNYTSCNCILFYNNEKQGHAHISAYTTPKMLLFENKVNELKLKNISPIQEEFPNKLETTVLLLLRNKDPNYRKKNVEKQIERKGYNNIKTIMLDHTNFGIWDVYASIKKKEIIIMPKLDKKKIDLNKYFIRAPI
ncbi:hypothetical protein K9L67_01935 [Candidatus Woesearchaeota archaeon]|nr:hypothetical protein [Candidatus Woesearchaeota archaeon]MCF7900964.1 hypothetical protein [Candidatus Woesearchaeota archaeon]MCF8013590.1 hypothetical protein [Candidatus Woesearchaeota archaeon]